MTEKQVNRYISLVNRRLQISTSGVNWKPEYGPELQQIEQELAELLPLVDAAHREKKE